LSILASTTDNEQKSLEYLRYELPTRLANMLKEMHRLPKELLETPSFEHVKKMYEETLNEVLVFEKANAKDVVIRDDFISSLSGIVNRHRSVVEQVAHAVLEYKEFVIESGIRTIDEEKMQYFLDRFYMSRIAIRVLINQHGKQKRQKLCDKAFLAVYGIFNHTINNSVTMFGDQSRDVSLVGAFDGKCDLRKVVEDAAASAQFLCEKYYLGAPEVEVELINGKLSDA